MKKIIAIIAAILAVFVLANKDRKQYQEPDWFNASLEELQDGVQDDQLIPVWGIVVSKDFEGYSEYDDNYTIECCGQVYNGILADDLDEGEEVTVYFADNQPVRVLAGWR